MPDSVGAQAGQVNARSCPTAFFRIFSASLAVILVSSLTSQTQRSQAALPTADLSASSASLALGPEPVLWGWPQSPVAACAATAARTASEQQNPTRATWRLLRNRLPLLCILAFLAKPSSDFKNC